MFRILSLAQHFKRIFQRIFLSGLRHLETIERKTIAKGNKRIVIETNRFALISKMRLYDIRLFRVSNKDNICSTRTAPADNRFYKLNTLHSIRTVFRKNSRILAFCRAAAHLVNRLDIFTLRNISSYGDNNETFFVHGERGFTSDFITLHSRKRNRTPRSWRIVPDKSVTSPMSSPRFIFNARNEFKISTSRTLL